MDVASYLQMFEASVSKTGDDPLDPWDKFVQFLESWTPKLDQKSLCMVLERLIHNFMTDQRYQNDPRFISQCIKFAGLWSDPVEVYITLHSRGVGIQAAPFFIDWALQYEKRGEQFQAERVFQLGIENRAQPQDSLMHQYRLFQGRTSALNAPSDHVREPLQESQLVNQNSAHREAIHTNCKIAKRICFISRSENNPVRSSTSNSSSVKYVSMYQVEKLQCEGTELSFEELRAKKYFAKCKEQEQHQKWEVFPCVSHSLTAPLAPRTPQMSVSQSDLECVVEEKDGEIENPDVEQDAPVVRRNLSTLPEDREIEEEPQETDGDSVCAALSHSHITPNSSLGFIQATPSRVQPSPTVNTREAIGVIMGMFQAPTLLQESTLNTSALPEDSFERSCKINPVPDCPRAPSATPFMVYHDTEEQENANSDPVRSTVTRALMPRASVDESTLWGGRNVSLGSCSGLTADFRLLAHLASTPLHSSAPLSQDKGIDENTELGSVDASDEKLLLRQQKKLSPIIEQSPADEKSPELPECSIGYINITQQSQGVSLSQSLKHPLVALSFPDQTTLRSQVESSGTWSGYRSPEKEHKPNNEGWSINRISKQEEKTNPEVSRDAWSVYRSPEERPKRLEQSRSAWSVCRSPEELPKQPEEQSGAWSVYRSPEELPKQPEEPRGTWSVYRSPEDKTNLPDISRSVWSTQQKNLKRLEEPKHNWGVYQSPEEGRKTNLSSMEKQDFQLNKELSDDVFMSPKATLGLNWFQLKSPTCPLISEAAAGEDLDVMKSPSPASEWSLHHGVQLPKTGPLCAANLGPVEVMEPMITEQSFLGSGIEESHHSPPMSSTQNLCTEEKEECKDKKTELEVLSSPKQGSWSRSAPMSPMDTSKAGCVHLVSDPWDEQLIDSLLSNLQPPLSSNPKLTVWNCRLPTVNPKMTVQIAGQSLRVDSLLGQGAFATVYQATNLSTSHKHFLKVQKPANPWEFYINEQLNARLSPSTRHLFNSIHSAQLFSNGSVLIGEIHNCGTLLSAVNLYRSRGEKLIPQPLVLYFAVCILQMVELLHQAQIIHADIKPDNFILGERFLENECFDMDNLHHGLVLIDLGQSIDMRFFQEGTAFTACCRTSGFQCTEMLSGRPWNYQTDYFGIAGTVYCLLFGTYMKVQEDGGVWKTNGVFKRMVNADLWQDFFHSLLNIPDCSTLPSLRSLRLRLNTVLQEEYSSKLRSLKNRLVVQILEARSSRR
ncbi:hypothetical protein DNTS_035814 [Danionella cerebrum]|uniref:Protein kinase domain-containing protein n=1 Tax=Danionella cerebrum TaxID=2873325 RepID=A0A553Q3E1_9TELE|nr:hypothetical protein DNTS_035814 [Danionella translucida]